MKQKQKRPDPSEMGCTFSPAVRRLAIHEPSLTHCAPSPPTSSGYFFAVVALVRARSRALLVVRGPVVPCFVMQISEASKALSKAMRRSGGADRFQEMYAEGLLRQKHRAAAVR